jgi:RimJ/RimL family protein N-acetyltransferase
MALIQMKLIEKLESDHALRDGAAIHIRPIRPEDDRSLIKIFNRSSPQTVYQRFFTVLSELTPAMVRYLSNVDYFHRFALIAEADSEPVGVARYERTGVPGTVELGLAVVDDWQSRGLGRILFREVLRAAQRNNIHRFCADVLAENRRMLRLLATECQIQDWKTEAGVTTLQFTARRSCAA